MTSIFVSAPYEDAAKVRRVQNHLRALGHIITSRWADDACGPENLPAFKSDEIQRMIRTNDDDIARAGLVIVMARHGVGGESFAEARWAIHLRKPVYWCGRFTLSAYREGVTRFTTIDDVLCAVERLKVA